MLTYGCRHLMTCHYSLILEDVHDTCKCRWWALEANECMSLGDVLQPYDCRWCVQDILLLSFMAAANWILIKRW